MAEGFWARCPSDSLGTSSALNLSVCAVGEKGFVGAKQEADAGSGRGAFLG